MLNRRSRVLTYPSSSLSFLLLSLHLKKNVMLGQKSLICGLVQKLPKAHSHQDVNRTVLPTCCCGQ